MKISDAKALAKKYNKDIVVIFHIQHTGELGYVSYGKDKEYCNTAKTIADVLYNKLLADWLYDILEDLHK